MRQIFKMFLTTTQNTRVYFSRALQYWGLEIVKLLRKVVSRNDTYGLQAYIFKCTERIGNKQAYPLNLKRE
jgi:hypothetical protein